MTGPWDKVVDNKIREAQEAGEFDGLRLGSRLSDADDSHIPQDERLAARVMKNAGVYPEWIEEDQGLRRMIDEARARFARSHGWRDRQLDQATSFEERDRIDTLWKRAVTRLEQDVADINKAIFAFNLRAPAASVQRRPLRLREELARVSHLRPAG